MTSEDVVLHWRWFRSQNVRRSKYRGREIQNLLSNVREIWPLRGKLMVYYITVGYKKDEKTTRRFCLFAGDLSRKNVLSSFTGNRSNPWKLIPQWWCYFMLKYNHEKATKTGRCWCEIHCYVWRRHCVFCCTAIACLRMLVVKIPQLIQTVISWRFCNLPSV